MNLVLWIYVVGGVLSLLVGALTVLSAFFVVPRLMRSTQPRQLRLSNWLLFAAYALFLADAYLSLSAFGGTLGDGATSTHRYVNPNLLLPIGVIQLACFFHWGRTRLSEVRFQEPRQVRHRAITLALLAPGAIALAFVVKVTLTACLLFRARQGG
jgi:hypothetical protein